MMGLTLDAFADAVDPSKLHVVSPTDFVFLCGGVRTKLGEQPPESLRDAFYKIHDFRPLRNAALWCAEDVQLHEILRSNYNDWLSFEVDLAQLAKVTLVFAESPGSMAEAGAFSVVPEIARRMLLLIRSDHFEDSSFLSSGLADFMRDQYGDAANYVMDKNTLGLNGSKPSAQTSEELAKMLEVPVASRLSEIENPSTFDTKKTGHHIKLVVGLIQEFGALTKEEISTLLIPFGLDIDPQHIERYLMCAEAVEWIIRKRKGQTTFAAAREFSRPSANFFFKDDRMEATASRRRSERRAEIKKADPDRFLAIQDGLGVSNA